MILKECQTDYNNDKEVQIETKIVAASLRSLTPSAGLNVSGCDPAARSRLSHRGGLCSLVHTVIHKSVSVLNTPHLLLSKHRFILPPFIGQ